jgi:hypothetical protein
VHVLDIEEEWAFCLDLPASFGEGDLNSTALAVSADGTTIAVADANAGEIAFASTSDLGVTRTAPFPEGLFDIDAPNGLHIALAGDSIAFGSSTTISWFDLSTFAPLEGSDIKLRSPLAALISGGDDVLAWTLDPTAGPEVLNPRR